MLKGDFSSEKAQASHVGKKVVTAKVLTASDYTKEGEALRRTEATGVIVGYSNSHGLCYGVRHKDGVVAWYDPDELHESNHLASMSVWDFTTTDYLTPEAIEKAINAEMPRTKIYKEVLLAVSERKCEDWTLCAYVAVAHMKV